MTSGSIQALRSLISKLEALPLRMGGGDREREALLLKLSQVVDGHQILSLSDLYWGARLLGSERAVHETFSAITASESAVLEFSSCAVPKDNNIVDNFARNLAELELPYVDSQVRAQVVKKLEAYLDYPACTLNVVEMRDAARLLGEDGNTTVEELLRKMLLNHLRLAAERLWSTVAAHFGILADLSRYVRGEVVLPKRGGSKSRQMLNVLPQIDKLYEAVCQLLGTSEITDIDGVVVGSAPKAGTGP